MRHLASILALLVMLIAPAASAQRLTDGLFLPDGDVAAGEGAIMLEHNPAGMAFGAPIELAYTYIDSTADARGEGHQVGLSLGLDPFRAGLNLQFLDRLGFVVADDTDPNGAGRPAGDDPLKLSLGYALKLSPAFAFGFAWHTFVSDDIVGLDEADTWDFGVQFRPLRWIAAGVSVTDLTSPRVGGVLVDRGYTLGLALRPGTERVTLTGTATLPEGDNREMAFGGLLKMRLFGSLGLQARYETTELPGVTGDLHRGHRLMIGLMEASEAGLGVFGYSPDLDGDDRAGFAVSARVRSSAPRTPRILARPKVVEVAVRDAAEYGPSGFFGTRAATPFLDALITLRRVSRLQEVKGVLLSIATSDLGWAQAAELRQAILELRAAGKKVYVWLPVGDTRSYSVAAAADAIYTTHAGGLLLTGIRAEITYLGDLVEAVGAKAEFVAIGDFKSAPEALTRSGPSDAARRAEDSLLDDLYGRVLKHIAEGRSMPLADVRRLVDEGPYTAAGAKEAGLVDGVVHYDEFEEIARGDFGPHVAFTDAESLLRGSDPRWGIKPAIGVLYVVGTITDGRSVVNPFTGSGTTGSESFVQAARAMREDPKVKAVVLRVDSPGGSVTAADAMWRELSRLAEAKPLIVSMGDVAASGGYYVAAPAQEVLASPETITGSIGIFVGKVDLSGMLEKVGVHRELFERGKRAGILSTARSWTDEERARITESMRSLYDLFLERVAAGRKGLSRAQVEPLAGGRVWTGAQARACGLVDRPAGILTAVDIAALSARLGDGDYRLQVQRPDSGFGGLPTSPVMAPVERLLSWMVRGSPAPVISRALAEISELPLVHFQSGQALALLPFIWR